MSDIETMNIKGLVPNLVSTSEVRKTDSIGKTIHSDSANDRDANGQEGYQQQGQQQNPMSEDELNRALEHLQKLSAFKEHKWQVEIDGIPGTGECFVLVTDNLGTLIRKIPESDLRTLPVDDSPRGQLLKRTA